MSELESPLAAKPGSAFGLRAAPPKVTGFVPHDRMSWVRFVLALGGLCCLGVTSELWQPQTIFPRVPLWEWVCRLSPAVDAGATWGALAISGIALLAILCGGASRLGICRWLALLVSAGWLTLVVLDQHRLQPWVVHIALSLLFACWAAPGKQLAYLQVFIVSIYVYSALGKLDAQFLNTVGRDMVQQLLASLGLAAAPYGSIAWRPSPYVGLAFVFPLFECLIGLGLLLKPTRKWSGWGAVGMHLILIWILGPWGLRHAWGVLVWNSLFVLLDVLLFVLPSPRLGLNRDSQPVGDRAEQPEHVRLTRPTGLDRMTAGVTSGLLWLVLLMPVGERFGWVDHWLGWALYAPHSSRALIQVSVAAVEKLPATMRPFVTVSAKDHLLWCDVRSDRWSLVTLAAPVVPQQRFQIGVARAVAEWVAPHEIRVLAQGPADRWTGRRRERMLTGREEILAAADQFWFNTCPIPTATGLLRREDET